MQKVVLIGLEQAASAQICRALAADSYGIEHKKHEVVVSELSDASLVFCGGESADYLPLLRRVREVRPALPFIVVTRIPNTKEWLDALEAGATDYISPPVETRQLRWVMESALPRFFAAS